MRSDSRGDSGFAEAMVSLMVVTVVLAVFLSALASILPESGGHAAVLDMSRFTGEVVDGTFVPHFIDYASSFPDASGARGISVSVTVPGGICAPMEPFTFGSMDGSLESVSKVVTLTDDDERSFPALVEVVVCGRAATPCSL